MRACPEKCEFIDRLEKPGRGTKMIYCRLRPTMAISVEGTSELFVCRDHCKRMQKMFAFFEVFIRQLAE